MHHSEKNPRLDRVGFELRATGVKLETANPLRAGIHSRGYLPHVKREGATYFVGFRLADALPRELLLRLEAERNARLRRLYTHQAAMKNRGLASSITRELEQTERDWFRRIERLLDQGCGACWMHQPEIAGIVAEVIRFFDRQRFRLDAWVVMPNHVHAVLWPMPNQTLSAILQTWKRQSAREANILLGRTGQPFWQPEPFDHWIRNDAEHARCCRYVIQNPVKAGLCAAPEDWPWSSAWNGGPAS